MYSPARSVSVESEDGCGLFAAEAPDGQPRRARPRAPAPLKVPKPVRTGGMGQTPASSRGAADRSAGATPLCLSATRQ